MFAPFSFGGAPLDWDGIPVLGAVKDQAGNDVLRATCQYTQSDLLITLCDPFALLPSRSDLATMAVAHWFPVDTSPMGEADVTVLREGGGIPVAMSRFGERVIRGEGGDPLYVPHGVDTRLFCPGDGTAYRESAEIGPETFVAGVLGMNRDPVRKGFFEQMLAFAKFHARHPDSVLTMHTANVASPGLNLAGMAARLGVTDAVRFPDTYSYQMALITREQQVSGSPFWSQGHGAMWTRPDVTDIEAAYEAAWQARENGTMPNAAAREFALTYDADLVAAQYWKPVLAELEQRI